MTQDIDVGKLSEQINDKADRDLWNTVPNVWNNTLNTSQITNCITEIPQDIKLELKDGTLTLKAGSKVYVPNGADKFDVVSIASDISFTYKYAPSTNTQCMLFINNTGTSFVYSRTVNTCYSGTTQPSGSFRNWYNTTENKMYSIGNNETFDGSGFSFPIAIITQGSDGVTKSIDQVFNGFGYIGSTVFALPGVKGMMPNGRNADGSLKNKEFVTDKVSIRTFTDSFTNNYNLYFNKNNIFSVSNADIYDGKSNTSSYGANIGKIVLANDVITSFTPKTAFHALDYNDRETVVGWGMPDYSATFSLSASTTPQQATMDMFVWGFMKGGSRFYVDISNDFSGDGDMLCKMGSHNLGGTIYTLSQCMVKKGNWYKVFGTNDLLELYACPMVGVN